MPKKKGYPKGRIQSAVDVENPAAAFVTSAGREGVRAAVKRKGVRKLPGGAKGANPPYSTYDPPGSERDRVQSPK